MAKKIKNTNLINDYINSMIDVGLNQVDAPMYDDDIEHFIKMSKSKMGGKGITKIKINFIRTYESYDLVNTFEGNEYFQDIYGSDYLTIIKDIIM